MGSCTLRWSDYWIRVGERRGKFLSRQRPSSLFSLSLSHTHTLSFSSSFSLSRFSPLLRLPVEQYPGCSQSLPNEAHLTQSDCTGHTHTRARTHTYTQRQSFDSIIRSSWSSPFVFLAVICRNVLPSLYTGIVHSDNDPLIGNHRYVSWQFDRRSLRHRL